jgi:UDP-N-acetylmuramoyl-L-alanyl-D-glutamate--2,6-diaminopimelate ligase
MDDRVTLAEVAARTGGDIVGDPTTPVIGVSHDSRTVAPGWLFVAVRGGRADGHRFIDRAVAAGATAVCVEEAPPGLSVPAVVVPDTRRAMGPAAATVYRDPAAQLTLIGITGTNGKTTVAHLLESIAAAAGLASGLLGTVAARIDGKEAAIERTTPEATDFQRLLRAMVNAGVELAAVEVSSHALSLSRATARWRSTTAPRLPCSSKSEPTEPSSGPRIRPGGGWPGRRRCR